MPEIKYGNSFEETVEILRKELERWFAGPKKAPPSIDDFEEPIYFKSVDGVIVHSNKAYREFFAGGITATGRLSSTFLHNSILTISEHTDALIDAGVQTVEFKHYCRGPDEKWYLVRSYKERLIEHHDGAYDILGISRPISFEVDSPDTTDDLEKDFGIYSAFDARDKRICILLAEGKTINQIADILDLSGKTIDNRRKKILKTLEKPLPIDIVKMMVRFEERGYL